METNPGGSGNGRRTVINTIRTQGIVIMAVICIALTAGKPVYGQSFLDESSVDLPRELIGFDDGIQVAQESDASSMEKMSGQEEAQPLKRITRLSAEDENGQVTIEVHGTGKLEYTVFKLLNPLRIVLDIPGMELGDLGQEMQVNKGVVDSVKPVYFDDTKVLRLEISLNSVASYKISRPMENQLHIKLQGEETMAEAPLEPEEPVRVAENTRMGQDAPGRPISNSLIDPCSEELSEDIKRISFDFQGADLKNILRTIAEVAGFNLVLSSDVKGSINIKLSDVLWNKALEIILNNNGLANVCDDNIMRVATEATLQASREEGVLVTELIRVNYADIDELFKGLVGVKSDRGSIIADERTSTLVITDVQDVIDQMRDAIRIIDKPTPQINISLRLVEIATEARKELGIGWGVGTERTIGTEFPATVSIGNAIGRATGAIGSGSADHLSDFTSGGGIFALNSPSFLVDLAKDISPTGSLFFRLANEALNTFLDVELRALETRGLARTLSRPKITTLDNVEAKIRKGQRIPFFTSSANEGITVEFFDADLELTVTPHVTEDERIFLKVAATKNSIGNIISGVGPSIVTSEASAELLVDNGSTSVLGGLTAHSHTATKEAVPFLNDIPFIGWMFKATTQLDEIDELLIFITPTIVRN